MRHGGRRTTRWTLLGLLAVGALMSRGPALGGEVPVLADDRLGTRTAPLLLLTRPDVQSDLALTAEQVASAAKAALRLHERALALRGQKDSPDVVAARRGIDEEQASWVSSQLTPEQQTRLQQIDLQWEGPSALVTRPSVAAAVGLSEPQVRELRGAIVALWKKAGPTQPPSELAPAIYERADAILTAAQKDQWKAMLGRPFQVVGRAPAATTAARR